MMSALESANEKSWLFSVAQMSCSSVCERARCLILTALLSIANTLERLYRSFSSVFS